MDNLELFKLIGLDEQNADKAMEVFCQEYSAITGTPQDEVLSTLSLPEDLEEPEIKDEDPIKTPYSNNFWQSLKNLVTKWFREEELPLAKRISRMISNSITDIDACHDVAAHRMLRGHKARRRAWA